MEKEQEKNMTIAETPKGDNTQTQAQPKKTNRTWEAAKRLKGSLIVNDPAFCCSMRYLIDTNIFVYLALDTELLSTDVKAI